MSARAFWAITAVATGLAVALRVADLDRESLWLDELWTVRIATQAGWSELFRDVAADVHPPLYFALVRLWSAVAGIGEAQARMPSVIAGVVAVPLTALVGRSLWGPLAGVLGAGIFAAMPYAVWMSREARSNMQLTALALAAVWATAGPLPQGRRARVSRLAVEALLAAALLYTHVWGALVLLGLGAWIAIEAMDGGRPVRDALARCSALLVGGLAFLPWTGVLARQVRRFAEDPWYGAPPPDALAYVLDGLFVGSPGPAIVIGVGLAGLLARRGGDRRGLVLLASLVVALIAVPQVVSALAAPILLPRNALPLLPFLCAAAGAGLASVGRASGGALGAAATALLASQAAALTFGAPRNDQWREAAAAVEAERLPDDVVIAPHPNLWRFYLPDAHLELPPTEPLGPDELIAWLRETRPAAGRAWVMDAAHSGGGPLYEAFAGTQGVLAQRSFVGARLLLVDPRLRTLSLDTLGVPAENMRSKDGLHFWWNERVDAPAPAGMGGRCALGVHGWSTGGAPGVEAAIALRLVDADGAVHLSTVHLGPSPETVFGEEVAVDRPARVEVAFTNDHTTTGPDGSVLHDLNAHLERVFWRCADRGDAAVR